MTKSTALITQKQLRRRKRQAVRRAACLTLLLGGIVITLRTATNYMLSSDTAPIEDHHVQAASSVTVKAPVERHSMNINADLKKYASASKTAEMIYKNRDEYPEALLNAYINNPEMEDFVAGYLNADKTSSQNEGLTAQEKEESFPLLLQWDKRWGYAPYGGSIIGLSGCGPTCLSMVLITLTGNETQTPAQVAQFSAANGYYIEGSGTAWSLMTEGAAQLGLSARELPLAESTMKSALDNGQPIICSMAPGDFTTEGHFILIYGYNEDGFLVNDPNCRSRSSQSWTFERLSGQIKNLWAYSL
ncbi:MAG: secreted protein containing domain of murein hydrolase [Eubacterium sp.]|nr:secreted protein containing domain of murein hydrolase [Eubacterium sp.]